jgi:metal-responsive CopG/Arc/MetJ family transcriptional regulator
MQRINIFLEEEQRQQVDEFARKEMQSFAEIVREMIDEGIRVRKRKQWEQAAVLMAPDYAVDKELTAFTSLDGEDFLE